MLSAVVIQMAWRVYGQRKYESLGTLSVDTMERRNNSAR
jgi:hypothetical protein